MAFQWKPSLDAVARLLAWEDMPHHDIVESERDDFLGCNLGDELIGVVGLEIGEDAALLCSLAVAPDHRELGLGAELVSCAEQRARERGARAVYLLTLDADGFFRRLGYRRLARAEAPAFIRSTSEFSRLCPASAAFMVKRLCRDVPAAD